MFRGHLHTNKRAIDNDDIRFIFFLHVAHDCSLVTPRHTLHSLSIMTSSFYVKESDIQRRNTCVQLTGQAAVATIAGCANLQQFLFNQQRGDKISADNVLSAKFVVMFDSESAKNLDTFLFVLQRPAGNSRRQVRTR